jgi:hypothetical protein
VNLLFAVADAEVADGVATRAKDTLDQATDLASGDAALAVACHLKAAEIEDLLGNRNQAEWERAQARGLQPQ